MKLGQAIKSKPAPNKSSPKRKITPKMADYLQILLEDAGYHTRRDRNEHLSDVVGREIKFLDELTFDEGRELIEGLIEEAEEARDARDEAERYDRFRRDD